MNIESRLKEDILKRNGPWLLRTGVNSPEALRGEGKRGAGHSKVLAIA